MERIFVLNKADFPSSLDAVTRLLKTYFGEKAPQIARAESGKPYLQNGSKPLFFSLSHTNDKLYIAFSSENVGIDAENSLREVEYLPILKRFPVEERTEISSLSDFLVHWTVRESAVKWLGGTLAQTMTALAFAGGRLTYRGLELLVRIVTKQIGDDIVTVCSERDFSDAQVIIVYHKE